MNHNESAFIKGLDLSESFYREAVAPLLRRYDGGLRYSAGLLGFGSDVLGYDTEISRDHMWGPRLYFFLEPEVWTDRKEELHDYLASHLPLNFRGYPVNFSCPDGEGIRVMERSKENRVDHLIFITTPEGMVREYLGHPLSDRPLSPAEWLTTGEHRLLAFTSGKMFHDDLDMEGLRNKYSFYPEDVLRFLMASLWEMISQKEAFVGRCGGLGDDLGSRLNAAAIVQYLMRLAFLRERKYAPYGKWFSTAFSHLKCAGELKPILEGVLSASDWKSREEYLCRAYVHAGKSQNKMKLCRSVPPDITDYYERPYRVIFAERYSEALSESIKEKVLRDAPKIGSVSQFSDICQFYDNTELTGKLGFLYGD